MKRRVAGIFRPCMGGTSAVDAQVPARCSPVSPARIRAAAFAPIMCPFRPRSAELLMSERTAYVERNTLETQVKVTINLDGTGKARFAIGVPFRAHARPDRPSRADRPGYRVQRRPAHRRPPYRRGRRHHPRPGLRQGHRRQERHDPLRARLRAAGRGAVARGDRLLRTSRSDHARTLHPCGGRQVRRRPVPGILPGLRQPRPGDPAHRQPARNQHPPPDRDGVQGLRPCAAHGHRARSAHGRADAVDQGCL